MNKYKIAYLILSSIAMVFVILGCSNRLEYPDDNAAEELAESIIENKIESALGLDDDALKDKIDFSFRSPEQDD